MSKYVAVELSRTDGSSAGATVTLEGWKNGVLVETQLVPLDEIDRWKMAVLRSTVDEVRVIGNGGLPPFCSRQCELDVAGCCRDPIR